MVKDRVERATAKPGATASPFYDKGCVDPAFEVRLDVMVLRATRSTSRQSWFEFVVTWCVAVGPAVCLLPCDWYKGLVLDVWRPGKDLPTSNRQATP